MQVLYETLLVPIMVEKLNSQPRLPTFRPRAKQVSGLNLIAILHLYSLSGPERFHLTFEPNYLFFWFSLFIFILSFQCVWNEGVMSEPEFIYFYVYRKFCTSLSLSILLQTKKSSKNK